MSHN